jgi:putative peptidoglycan lipid II flippase
MNLDFLRTESYKKGLVMSASLNLVARIFGFANLLAITFFFGARTETDVYFYCFAAAGMMSAFLTSVDASVLIPESMRLSAQEGTAASRAFLNLFLYVFLFIGLAVMAAGIASPVRMFLLISKFDEAALLANSGMAIAAVFLVVLMLLTAYLVDILTSLKYFTLPMASNMVNAVFSMGFMLLFHEKAGALSIMLGLLTAYALQLLLLVQFMRRYLGWDFSFRAVRVGAATWRNIAYALAGNVTSVFVSYVPLFLFSGFGAGMITSLNAGQRIADLPTLLVITQASAVVGIKFNALFAEKQYQRLDEIFRAASKTLLFALVPLSCFTWLYGRELIALLYRHGSFDAAAVDRSAAFLKFLILLPPLLAVNTLVSRLFSAGQKIREGFWYQIVFNVVSIIFIYAGTRRFGAIGYPAALLALHSLNFLGCYALLGTYFGMVRYGEVLRYLAGVALVNAAIALAVHFLRGLTALPGPLWDIAAGGLAYLLLLTVLARVFRIDREMWGFLKDLRQGVLSRG